MDMDQQPELRTLPLRELDLPSGEVHVWYLDFDALPAPDPITGPVPARQQRLRQRFYLRLLLAAHLGRPAHAVRLDKTANGKPYIRMDDPGLPDARPPLYFSLSHAGSALLVALCRDAPVGVDMERPGRQVADPLRLAKRYFHPAEHHWLEQLPATQLAAAWLRMWTCKEAVVKATGGGIVSGLHRFAITLQQRSAEITAAINEPADDVLHSLRISLPNFSADSYVAVAHHHQLQRLRLFRLTAD
jgi:phosphopantetheinyl transferase